MKFPIVTRMDAANAGLKRFYTGKPCKYGHDAQRFTTTGGCVACNAARSKLFAFAKNTERGKFVYPLHPDDHAAARAYCQALDLARGYVPQTDLATTPAPRGAEPVALPDHIARHRQALTDGGHNLPPTSDAAELRRRELFATLEAQRNPAPYLPKP